MKKVFFWFYFVSCRPSEKYILYRHLSLFRCKKCNSKSSQWGAISTQSILYIFHSMRGRSGKYPRHNLSRLMSGICQEMTGSRWPGLLIQIQRTFPVDAFQCRGEISEGQRLDKLLTGREKMVVAKIVTKIQIYFEKLALWIIRTLLALWYIVIPWVILLLQTWPGRRSKPLIQRFSKDFRNSNLRNEDFSNVRKFSKLCFKGFCRIIEIPTFRAMFIQRFDWIYDFHRPKTWLLLLASIVASVFCYGSAYS